MFDSSTFFWLILAILVLIAVCLLLIAYEMAKRDMEKDRLRRKTRSEALKECAYFFGFLSTYPLGKPVPDECFGCLLALSCVRAAKPTAKTLQAPAQAK